MSDVRHIHDPVLSSLKMEGLRLFISNCTSKLLLYLLFYFLLNGTTKFARESEEKVDKFRSV
jgi:hypothetical protein